MSSVVMSEVIARQDRFESDKLGIYKRKFDCSSFGGGGESICYQGNQSCPHCVWKGSRMFIMSQVLEGKGRLSLGRYILGMQGHSFGDIKKTFVIKRNILI